MRDPGKQEISEGCTRSRQSQANIGGRDTTNPEVKIPSDDGVPHYITSRERHYYFTVRGHLTAAHHCIRDIRRFFRFSILLFQLLGACPAFS